MSGSDRQFPHYRRIESTKASRFKYSERVHCGNAFRMVGSEPSLAIKSCACASISLSLEYVIFQIDVFSYRHYFLDIFYTITLRNFVAPTRSVW